MIQVLKPKKKKRKRLNLWRYTMTMFITVVMVTSGAFGLLPQNPVTLLFQKVISENFDYAYIEPLNSFLAEFHAPQIPKYQNAGETGITQNPLLDPTGMLIGLFASPPTPGAPNDGDSHPTSEIEKSLIATEVSVILTDAFIAKSTPPTPSATTTATATTGTPNPIATPTITSTPTPTLTITPLYYYASITPTLTITPTYDYALTLTTTPAYYYDFPTETQTPAGTPSDMPPMFTDDAPFVVDTSPANGATGVASTALITVIFSEAVYAGDFPGFITCVGVAMDGGGLLVPVSGAGTSVITFDPGSLPASRTCTVTVSGSQISDVDFNDPPDTMMTDYSFTFDVAP